MEQYLEFKGIGKAYPGVQALKDVSFKVTGGKVMALVGETLLTLPTMTNEQDDINTQLEACRLMGFVPRRVEFKSNFHTLLHAISQGKGICFCPKLKNLRFNDDIRYYPSVQPELPSVAVVWRSNKLSREAKNFVNMLPEEAISDISDIPNEASPE